LDHWQSKAVVLSSDRFSNGRVSLLSSVQPSAELIRI
jgi:hypothetical protein